MPNEPLNPIDYASAGSRPKSRWWMWTLVAIAIFLLAVAGAMWFGQTRYSATGYVTVTNVTVETVVIPDDYEITLAQRTSGRLPGGGPTAPTVAIDDITRGQTLVKVLDENDALLLSRSMKEGETATFRHGDQQLHLTVSSLKNNLTGEDFATIKVSASQPSKQLTEAEKIEALIKHIESLEGAKFIRNGEAHDPKPAADHLRRKLRNAGDRVKTANDFIDGLATKSSMSGELYKIKLKDGTEVPSGEYLKKQLKEIK